MASYIISCIMAVFDMCNAFMILFAYYRLSKKLSK